MAWQYFAFLLLKQEHFVNNGLEVVSNQYNSISLAFLSVSGKG